MSTTRLTPTSSDNALMKFLVLMILMIAHMSVYLGTAMAGESDCPAVEPYRPEDLAYLDESKTIPWADAATVAAFVAQLKSYPKDKYDHIQPPRQAWMTYIPELVANNYIPEKIESRAPAIANFKRQLDAFGINMIFLPIPEGGMIYPDLYWEGVPLDADGLPSQTTEGNRRLFAVLDKLGVNYVNLTPAMIMARKYSRHGHCREFLQGYDGMSGEGSHWTYYGVAVSAHVVAAEIAKLPWYKSLPKLDGLKAEWVAPKRYGPEDDQRDWQWKRRITGTPKDLTDAPIMVVGDSNMISGFGFHHQLMYELKVPVDMFGGAGKNLSVLVQRASENPDWLLKKKLVIWSIANRYLYSGVHEHVIFPDGIEMARKRVAALAGWPSRVVAEVTLEKNSTAKTPEQWQPYTSALIYGRYRVERSWSAAEEFKMPAYTSKTIMAAGWGLIDGQPTWLTGMMPGTRYQISAESMIDHPELDEMAADQDAYEDLALRPYLITEIKDPDGKPLVNADGKRLILPLNKFEIFPGEAQIHQRRLPAETNNIRYSFDSLEINDQTYLDIQGWTFIEHEDTENREIYVILKSADREFIFNAETTMRQDITKYFKELDLDLDHSGFMARIPVRKIANGQYTVGLYIKKNSIEALQYTQKTILKSGGTVQVK